MKNTRRAFLLGLSALALSAGPVAARPIVLFKNPTLPPVVPGGIEAVGTLTRAGVKVTQIAAGSSLSGTNANHFAIDSAGVVTVSSAGQTAGLNGGPYLLTTTDPANPSLTIQTVAGEIDVSDGNTYLAAINAYLAANASTDWLCRPRAGTQILATSTGGYVIQKKVFAGSMNDPNKGIIREDLLDLAAKASITGGSFTTRPRSPMTARITGLANTTTGRGLVLWGSSGFVFEDMIIENIAGASSYNRKIDSSEQDVTAVAGTSCIHIRCNENLTTPSASNPEYGNHIFRRCLIGAPEGGDYTRFPFGLDVDQAMHVVVEDCIVARTYNGIRNQTCGFLTVRRTAITDFLVDAFDGYPNKRDANTPTPPFSECFIATSQNTYYKPNLGPEFAGAHCDSEQFGTGSDDYSWRISSHYNVMAMDADQTVKETQNMLYKDQKAGLYTYGRASNNIMIAATLNGVIFSHCDPSDRFVLANCTIIRSTKAPPKSGNGGPLRITVEESPFDPDNGVHGPLIQRCIYGVFVDATGSGAVTYSADPVAGGLGSRTLTGGGTVQFDRNFYLSHLTQNTGANNSLPEIFPAMAGSAYVPGTGYQFDIDYTSVASIRASAAALFAVNPSSPAAGAGAAMRA